MLKDKKEKKMTYNVLGRKVKACCPECAIQKGLKMMLSRKKR